MKKSRPVHNIVRSVNYATSPLLASKTPPWRSRFVVVLVGAAFLLLLGRAVQVQIVSTDFYRAQGEKRFVHKLPLHASRGRILDRNGLVLATSVAMPSVQVEAKTFAADSAQRKALAGLLAMPAAELEQRLATATGTVTLRRHVQEAAWQEVKALRLRGVQEVREYQRRYPEGEAAAHVVGFTDIDDRGQEGIELGFQTQLLGKSGQRMVVRDRLGRVVEDIGDQADPVDGRDITLSIDSKVQFFAWQRLRDAVHEHGARAGSVVVLDVQGAGRGAGAGQLPQLRPCPAPQPQRCAAAQPRADRYLRARFDDEALHRRAGAGDRARHAFDADPDRPWPHHHHRLDHQRCAPARRVDGGRGDPEVQQRRHREDGDADTRTRNVGDVYADRPGPEAAHRLPRRRHRPAATLQELAARRAGHHELRLRPVGEPLSVGARLHGVRARRRAEPGDHPAPGRTRPVASA